MNSIIDRGRSVRVAGRRADGAGCLHQPAPRWPGAAAIEAAGHAGQAAEAATVAAEDAVDTAVKATAIFEAARAADAERIAVARDDGIEVARDDGIEVAQAALAEYQAQQAAKHWDTEQAAQRDAQMQQFLRNQTYPGRAVQVGVTRLGYGG